MYETLGHYVRYCSLYLSIPPSLLPLSPSCTQYQTCPQQINTHSTMSHTNCFLSQQRRVSCTLPCLGRVKSLGHIYSSIRFTLCSTRACDPHTLKHTFLKQTVASSIVERSKRCCAEVCIYFPCPYRMKIKGKKMEWEQKQGAQLQVNGQVSIKVVKHRVLFCRNPLHFEKENKFLHCQLQ